MAQYASIKSAKGIVLPEVRKVLLDRKKKDAERSSHRTGVIYPSEMSRADWCPRSTYYRMSGRPEPSSSYSFSLENVFSEGNAIHNKWQSWLAETGKLWGDWRCTRCSEYVQNSLKPDISQYGHCVGVDWVRIEGWPPLVSGMKTFPHDWHYKEVTLRSPTHKISGHADGALVDHNCLIELKSVGVGTLRFEAPTLLAANTHSVNGKKIIDIDGMWKELHRPLLAHVKQGNIYLWMAAQLGMPFDKMVFVYEFKANQQVKEFEIRASADILDPMLETAEMIQDALLAGVAPKCPHGGCGSCRAYEKEEA